VDVPIARTMDQQVFVNAVGHPCQLQLRVAASGFTPAVHADALIAKMMEALGSKLAVEGRFQVPLRLQVLLLLQVRRGSGAPQQEISPLHMARRS